MPALPALMGASAPVGVSAVTAAQMQVGAGWGGTHLSASKVYGVWVCSPRCWAFPMADHIVAKQVSKDIRT